MPYSIPHFFRDYFLYYRQSYHASIAACIWFAAKEIIFDLYEPAFDAYWRYLKWRRFV